jgi:hypothetical protein
MPWCLQGLLGAQPPRLSSAITEARREGVNLVLLCETLTIGEE